MFLKFRKHVWVGLWFAVVLITVFSCSSRSVVSEDTNRYSNVSVVNPNFKPKKGQSIAWYAPIAWSSDTIIESLELRSFLTKLVEDELSLRGFNLAGSINDADYIVAAAIVDDHSVSSKNLIDFFHLFPSLKKADSDLKEAEALIGVVRTSDLKSMNRKGVGMDVAMWRASLKALALGEKISESERENRYRYFVRQLMHDLPNAR